MVVLYDGGDHSDMVLRTASWLEHSKRFNTTILSIKREEEGKHIGYSRIDNQGIRYKKDKEKEKHVKHLDVFSSSTAASILEHVLFSAITLCIIVLVQYFKVS